MVFRALFRTGFGAGAAIAGLWLAAAAAESPPERLVALHTLDIRVAKIGFRLATAGGGLCAEKVGQPGIVLTDLALYSGQDRADAARLFRLADDPVITATVIDGPLSPGDIIIGIDGRRLGAADPKHPYARIAAIEAALEAGPVSLTVRRDGAEQDIRVEATPGCRSRVQIVPGASLNASADGTYVQLTDAVVRETADAHELAFVIAHEMAHNILHHAEQKGRKLDEEIAADRLGLKLMKAAGYEPAARFWTRFGAKTGFGIFSDGSHMRTKARVEFLTDEAAALTQ